MKKSHKILRIVLIVFGVIVVLGVVLFNLFVNRALKLGIEKGGSSALKVGVRVDKVDLGVLAGSLGFANLVIDNPQGYKHENLLVLKDAKVAVNTGSLFSDTITIKDIQLDGMELVIEQKGLGNNLNDLIKSLPSKEEQKTKEPSGKNLVIDNLDLSNISVSVKLLSFVEGTGDTITLKLKPIKMTDLGSDEKLDVAVLVGKVLVAIAGGIAEQGLGVIPDEILGPMTNELKRVSELSEALLKGTEKLLKGGTDVGGDVLKDGKDVGKNIKDGLKGLLGGKKEQEDK
ncbi:MAG: AsmA family protein [Planctomycetota bacterium]